MRKYISPLGLGAILLGASFSALSDSDAASLNLLGFKFTPKLDYEQLYIDNLFYSRSDNETSSFVSVLRPSWQLSAGEYKYKVTLDQEIEAGFYSESEDDNYLDHKLKLGAFWAVNSKNSLFAEVLLSQVHEERGSRRRSGQFGPDLDLEGEPNELQHLENRFKYTLGNNESSGKLNLGLSAGFLEFTNNEEITRDREYDDIGANAEFFWKLTDRTNWIVGTRVKTFDYEFDQNRDNDQQNYFTGVSWQGTAKTRGSIRVGSVNKQFTSDNSRSDFSGASWSADVMWLPRTYSTLSLRTSKAVRETFSDGDFIDESSWAGSWKHDWNKRYTTTLSFLASGREFVGSPSERDDNVSMYTFELGYQMRRWLNIGMLAQRRTQDSNIDNFDYTRHKLGLNLELSL